MLTDTKLRNLKPQDKLYKVIDRDGLYAAVSPKGTVSFRYNYSISGRQETLTIGRFGRGGITLAEARELLNDAKKMVVQGKSPAREKARDRKRVKGAETFGVWAEKWLRGYQMADSTRDMRKSVYNRELKKKFGNQKLSEITHEDLRTLADAIVERGAPATAVHAREVVMQVYRWAIDRGQKVENPADRVRPTSIAKFTPRDRSLNPAEIDLMYRYMNRVGTSPQYRAAIKFLSDAEQQALIATALALLADKHRPGQTLTSPGLTRQYLRMRLADQKAELFGCLFLDSQHQILEDCELFYGTIDTAAVYPRIVVQKALGSNAAAVMLYHNHCSGVTEPSRADEMITKRLQDALGLVDIRVLDHFVVSAGQSTSFAEKGLL